MAFNLKKIPSTPGFINFLANMRLFNGKAKNLKKESQVILAIHIEIENITNKTLTDDIETFSTKNEVEALPSRTNPHKRK